MKDSEFRCLMSDISYPEFLRNHPEVKSFIEKLIERDPKNRPRFCGIKSHPWLSNIEFDANKLKTMTLPEWVRNHVRQESKSKPMQMRRRSMGQSKPKKDLSLNLFMKDICAHMIENCNKEDADRCMAQWMTSPSSKTKALFRHWNYISDDAMTLEIKAADQNNGQAKFISFRKMRRATQ